MRTSIPHYERGRQRKRAVRGSYSRTAASQRTRCTQVHSAKRLKERDYCEPARGRKNLTRAVAEVWRRGQSGANSSLVEFPDQQGINTEFHRNGASEARLIVHNPLETPRSFGRIPYSTEQGIYGLLPVWKREFSERHQAVCSNISGLSLRRGTRRRHDGDARTRSLEN
jgi:hypothetical protein